MHAQNPCGISEAAGPSSPLPPTATNQTTAAAGAGTSLYWQFAAVAGNIYHFETCGLTGSDTELRVYAPGIPTSVLAYSDDDCGLQSSLNWTCSTSGAYRVQLAQYSCITFITLPGNIALTYSMLSPPTLTAVPLLLMMLARASPSPARP